MSPMSQADDEQSETQGADLVGGDRIDVGQIAGGNVAIGQGAQVIVNYINQMPAEKAKPRQDPEPQEMAFIPAGPFVMGDRSGALDALPQSAVILDYDFLIAVTPVTNREYAQFIWKKKMVATPAMLWDGNSPPQEMLDYPVMGVTWYEALAYCQWLRDLSGRPYRLPSEAEWEKAARGVGGSLYPWGNEWDAARCNAELGTVTPVKQFPAQNDFGCFDLVGNAREWTTTLWGTDPNRPDARFAGAWGKDGRDDLDAPSTMRRIYRGGQGADAADYVCSARGSYAPDKPGPRRQRHGFRVVCGE